MQAKLLLGCTFLAIVCFCKGEGNDRTTVYIILDGDTEDRALTVNQPNITYVVNITTQNGYKYKFNVDVLEAKCKNDDILYINGRQNKYWHCTENTKERILDALFDRFSLQTYANWEGNSAKLLITAYLETDQCPEDYFRCSGCAKRKNDEENKTHRCIHKDLKCNGRINCGNCEHRDESSETCLACPACAWSRFHDTQYMLTILLAGLFFVMSPVAIVVVLYYHKKSSASSARQPHSRNGSVDSSTMDPRNSQPPPNYDDLHDTKLPPPHFSEVVPSHSAANANTETRINGV